ncbi:high affinity cGMP-specific 3 -5 -cyclic phosphodiesterase 9A-like [Brachionus plicatilis]|uniref:High affinity cGMP-specific 3-5-cyclic phosphodiesterase 9A-like n=1 Tax=Brachionus plicatilis TaxID=10195 RepID=A0A3M7Q0U2_BRAPC|nr:high affinity cGMP-specific 3 -5 -cyclic phosphodiesterase 9A-like [Brachionus plicatilis]
MSNLHAKLLYVRIENRIECIEFDSNTTTEDLKETLRSAAEANQNDILKLYNHKGNLVAINGSLPVNISSEPYRLQVIAKNIVDYNNELKDLIERIEHLEIQLNSLSSQRVEDLHSKVKNLCSKLENIDHLSFIGLFKDTRLYTVGTFSNEKNETKKENIQNVYEKFKSFSMVKVDDETRQFLKSPHFDNWKFEDAELLVLLQQIFIDLNLVSKFSIKMETLQSYLFEIYSNYNDVPYHNFRHAFVVTQMMYSLIWSTKLFDLIGSLEILALIVSALSHDLDHDGFNNNYQINAQTHLAMIYSDKSPLEMYHCAVAFHILNKPESNIFSQLDKESFKKIREYIVQ